MAYCRFDEDSDVYLYEDVNGGWSCVSCAIEGSLTSHGPLVRLDTIDDTISHLKEHIKHGHKVPDKVIAELEKEQAVSK